MSGGRRIACPSGLVKHHGMDYKTLQDPGEGFLVDGQVDVTADLMDITVTTNYTQRTLGDDMSIINVEAFGCPAITSRLEEGRLFGIVSKTKIRTEVLTANLLVRQCAESVSQLRLSPSKA